MRRLPARARSAPPSASGAGSRRGRARRSPRPPPRWGGDRKSTRLNSSHTVISYAVFCLKNKLYRGATLLKPNHTEAARLVGWPTEDPDALERAGRRLVEALDGSAVLVTRVAVGMSRFPPRSTPFPSTTLFR